MGGQPTKGFSIALRAASTAERHRLVPVMLEALAALAIIFNDISEFEAARDFVEAALPMVCHLLYAVLPERLLTARFCN